MPWVLRHFGFGYAALCLCGSIVRSSCPEFTLSLSKGGEIRTEFLFLSRTFILRPALGGAGGDQGFQSKPLQIFPRFREAEIYRG